METETFQVKAGSFEGPFALLLSLVEKRKLFINDVSLAQVTEDFLNYLNRPEGVHHDDVSSFVLVASTLILIKSKSLLPTLNLTTEEEADIKNLEDRLKLYELFTKLSVNVKDGYGKNVIFSAPERKNDILVFLPDSQITKDSMMTFAKGVLGNMPKKTFLPKVEVKKVISIEEMIDKLTERVKSSLRTSFSELHGRGATREEKVVVIVGFLAMLELVKEGIINAIQNSHHDDIIMEKPELGNTI